MLRQHFMPCPDLQWVLELSYWLTRKEYNLRGLSRVAVIMGYKCFWFGFILFCYFLVVTLCDQDGMFFCCFTNSCCILSCFTFISIMTSLMLFSAWIIISWSYITGFLSLSCGRTTNYTDSSNISWVSDDAYISTGNTTTVNFTRENLSSMSLRFFPDSRARECYKLPIKNLSSRVLLRATFVYKNYDGLGKPPRFFVSVGTAIASIVNLTVHDPWSEEFVWPINKETLSFCLHSIPNGGNPVISSLELRPLPHGSYETGVEDSHSKLLRNSYRMDCGYANGSIRLDFIFSL